MRRVSLAARRRTSLCDSLNRVLDTGAVVMGELIISVAGVDLLYLNLNVLLSSVETLLDAMEKRPSGTAPGAPAEPLRIEGEREATCVSTT
jgi:hypothetical protein